MSKSLFDHLNAIYTNQSPNYFTNLERADKKTYSCYMINRGISMNMNYLPIVNEINQYWGQIGPAESYLFYSQLLPKTKQYNKWVKSSKEEKYEKWLVELIAKHYECSSDEAIDALTLFFKTDVGIGSLREIIAGYGISPKQMKKAGL